MLFFRFLLVGLLLGLFVMFSQALQSQQQVQQMKPSYELKVGARNSTIRNIGSFQVDSALIFPKRQAKDTSSKSKALRRNGVFFYDSVTHIVWFYDGKYFRRADSSIYNSDGIIEQARQVDIRGKDKAYLYFKNGAVWIDTLLLKNSKKGTSFDSLLVVKNDSVYRIGRDSVFNIYNKSDSIKDNRTVTLQRSNSKGATSLHFTKGSVHIDTLLLRKSSISGKSRDSFLVRYKDTVKYLPFDSLRTIYNKDDSIKDNRTVTLQRSNSKGATSLHFTKGSVHIDTLLLRKSSISGKSRDSFLVRYKDTVKYLPFDSLRTIYNKDDSIKEERVVTIKARNGTNKLASLKFKDGSVHIDTLLLKKLKQGSSKDSILVVKNDSVRRISVDSLKNIYTKSDSIIANREVVLHKKPKGVAKYYHLHFKGGAVWIDTLLLRNKKLGRSSDSLLVVRKDSVYRIGRDSVFNIYNKDDSIKEERVVTIKARNGTNKLASLKFKDGSVHIDTLLLRKLKQGSSKDSILVVKNDSVRRISVDSLKNIYTKSDSIIANREVVLHKKPKGKEQYYHLHFKGGAVWIDTLLLRNRKLGTSFDSLLVVRKDSVYRIGRDSVFNIYNKSDSIREERIVTIKAGNNNRTNKLASLKFKEGRVEFDTIFLRGQHQVEKWDSVLVVKNDTVRKMYLGDKVNIKNIYINDDSIKSKRIVTLADQADKVGQSLHFIKGSVHIDTLLLKNGKKGTSFDSLLVVRKDSVYRIGRDSVFNIYNKSDSIKSKRTVTLSDKGNKVGQSLHFIKGSVHIDTLLLKNRTKGTSFDSLLVVRKDSVYRIGRDSVFNIYNKSDSIKEERIVTIKAGNNKPDVTPALKFKDGRVEVDTLLVRKRRLGLSTDTLLVVHKDTVRYIPKDSLWNIYTGDDSLRKTGTAGKRTVYLNAKKLIFALGNTTNTTTNTNDSGKVGIGQKDPLYTLDIATKSAEVGATPTATTSNDYDSIAVRITHNVTESSGSSNDGNAQTRYGLVISENSNKAFGRSALGFYSGHTSTNFMKARLWTQVGNTGNATKFGIDVADKNKNLQTRMVIDHEGKVGIGIQNPVERLHIRGQKDQNNLSAASRNLIKLEAPGTGVSTANTGSVEDVSGLWLTEHNNNWGWIVLFNADNNGATVTRDKNAANLIQNGDYFSIERTAGSGNGYSDNQIAKHPALRITGTFGNGTFGNRNSTSPSPSPIVVVSPFQGTGNGSFQIRVHGAVQASAFTGYSDSILKKDIHNIDQVYGRNIINSLRPVTYHMRSDLELQGKQDTINYESSGKQALNYGFIAQDVERVMPDIVTKSKFRIFHDQPKFFPDSIKSMNYSAIIAPLVANVQLLNKDLQKAESKLATLEQENATLRSHGQDLQNKVEGLQSQVEELQQLFRKYIEIVRQDKDQEKLQGHGDNRFSSLESGVQLEK